MEVLLPDGDIIRTGQWAVDNCPSAFACRAGFGPQVDGLFLQSNLGIVTKLGISVQPQPDTMMSVCLEMDNLEDLQDLVNILAELRREDILQNDPSIFNAFRPLSRLGPRHQVYPDPGAIPEDALKAMMKENGWAYWKTWFTFYGPKDMVLFRLAFTQKTVTRISPRSRLSHKLFEGRDGEKVDPTTIPTEWQPTNAGVPTIRFASTIDYNAPSEGKGGHLDFSPILPYDAKSNLEWYQEATRICREHGFDSFVGGHAFGKHLIFIHIILYDRTDEDHDSVDPNGILSPGKSGIWPKAYREKHQRELQENGQLAADLGRQNPLSKLCINVLSAFANFTIGERATGSGPSPK
ncbi:MAG: hypothetical protein Q9195_006611 [Heterodermia aff. obscurata]